MCDAVVDVMVWFVVMLAFKSGPGLTYNFYLYLWLNHSPCKAGKATNLLLRLPQRMAFVVEYTILTNLAAPFSTLEFLTNQRRKTNIRIVQTVGGVITMAASVGMPPPYSKTCSSHEYKRRVLPKVCNERHEEL